MNRRDFIKLAALAPLVPSIDLNSLDSTKRTVRVIVATESPVKRWFGVEILNCDASSVNLERINAGAAVLIENDVTRHVGNVLRGWVTRSRTVEAEIFFARNPLGDSAMTEVARGELSGISVGYRVEEYEENGEEYRATRWTPMEVSFTRSPLDPLAKVI